MNPTTKATTSRIDPALVDALKKSEASTLELSKTAPVHIVRMRNLRPADLELKPELRRGPHGGHLYTSPSGTFEVYGAILEKYLQIGAEKSVLGYPVTNETGCPDGVGRYNHFQGGSIYWSPSSGAHVIYGAIRDRWAAIGWEKSYLGYPTSDEQDFDEGGRVNAFQGGAIYWWPDAGAIDLNEVVVNYTGLVCFGETDWDQSSDSDEPYVLFGVISPTGSTALSSRIYDDVDGGDALTDLAGIFRGKPGGLAITVTLMEHDFGDPDKYLDQVKAGVSVAAATVSAAVTLIPVVGPILAAGTAAGMTAEKDAIAREVGKLLDLGDDTIDTDSLALTPKQMIVLAARTPDTDFKGIEYKVESPLLTGEGASYKVYFSLATT